MHSYLEYARSLNYKERVPSIEEFLCSDEYIGKLTGNGQLVYPVWKDTLQVISREDSKYLIVLTGAIGTGKTRAALYGALYTLCRILCLRDPWKHFGLTSGGQMSIVFFNLTKSESESRTYALFQSHLVNSPWFCQHGVVAGSEKNPRVDFPLIKYTFASPLVAGFGSQGEDVIIALMDEVDSPSASEVQKNKVIKAYENARRRLDSRFVVRGETIGRFFMVASKQERLSFLNAFVTKHKNSPSMFLVDIPLWKAKPQTNYSGENFSVMVGDVYTPPRILDSLEDKKRVVEEGVYQVLDVPVEYRESFEGDIVGALRDIAGISVSHVNQTKLFPSTQLLQKCYTDDPNPVKQLTIRVGLQDKHDLLNYLDMNAFVVPRNIPRCIHVDYAYSGDGDACGIGMSCVSGWAKQVKERPDGSVEVNKAPVVHTDFGMRIKGHPGDKIPLHLVRKFIIDLKERARFNIIMVTYDLAIATESDRQILTQAGLKTDSLSMDKSPQYYLDFSQSVYEQRWTSPFNPFLHFELKHLEYDPVKNKIDHPNEVSEIEMAEDGSGVSEVVLVGSKDVSDGVVGSVSKALELCITPPDVEVMTEIMEKASRPPVDEMEDMMWRMAGVEVKRQDAPPKPSKAPGTSEYIDMLRKARDFHRR